MSMIQIPYPFQKLSKRFAWLRPFFTLVLLLFFLSAPLFFLMCSFHFVCYGRSVNICVEYNLKIQLKSTPDDVEI